MIHKPDCVYVYKIYVCVCTGMQTKFKNITKVFFFFFLHRKSSRALCVSDSFSCDISSTSRIEASEERAVENMSSCCVLYLPPC